MQLALLLVCCLATKSSPNGQIAEVTASFDGQSVLTKRYQAQAGSPTRDYVLSHRSSEGKWVQLTLGAFGNEDWEEDYLASSGNVVFVGVGTQVGYSVPIVALMRDNRQQANFMAGKKFSLEAGWWRELGLAFFDRHVVFLCQIKDKMNIVVSDGATAKTAIAPKGIVWIGTCGDSLIYRSEKDGEVTYRSSRKLPTFGSGVPDLHLDNVFRCAAITGD